MKIGLFDHVEQAGRPLATLFDERIAFANEIGKWIGSVKQEWREGKDGNKNRPDKGPFPNRDTGTFNAHSKTARLRMNARMDKTKRTESLRWPDLLAGLAIQKAFCAPPLILYRDGLGCG